MKLDKDFIQRIKQGNTRMTKIGIIDDNSNVSKEQINSQLFCQIDEYPLKTIIMYTNDKIGIALLSEYDILFWDNSILISRLEL